LEVKSWSGVAVSPNVEYMTRIFLEGDARPTRVTVTVAILGDPFCSSVSDVNKENCTVPASPSSKMVTVEDTGLVSFTTGIV